MSEKESAALRYHSQNRPGKIQVVPTKPYSTQRDLALAYSPGVAEPCLAISNDSNLAYRYTAKSNLVAVVSNGTAVLGLGDIGALASKPVMEGKGLLFKVFADIDVFDIELGSKDVSQFVETVKAIAPTFGGINLEDIKAPECFEIEERLKKELNIPVMHDDQHGTAIISAAGLLNALELVGKKIENIKVVVNGAGAAAVSCARMYISLGVKSEHLFMCDSVGVLTTRRQDLNAIKVEFARETEADSLAAILKGADLFLGLSAPNVLTPEMIQSMAENPIVFALANPKPEISYEDAMGSRADLIFATGRSDYPNQINNVLGFPYIFRGALDTGAKCINEEMKLAAVHALAELARETVPESVLAAYGLETLSFGKNYIIPTPFDPRLISRIAPAVAKAAMESGVARIEITDWDVYKYTLEKRLGQANKMMHLMRSKAKKVLKHIAFTDGADLRVIQAAAELMEEGVLVPVLLGNKTEIEQLLREQNVGPCDFELFDPNEHVEEMQQLMTRYYSKMQRHGVNLADASLAMKNLSIVGMLLLEQGMVDGCVVGLSSRYTRLQRRSMDLIGLQSGYKYAAAMHIVSSQKGTFFLADTNINRETTIDNIVSTIQLTYDAVKQLDIEPVMALCSYSNFGESETVTTQRMRAALDLIRLGHPHICIDGEMRADIALNVEMRMRKYPFTRLSDRRVNTLIFPNLDSGNISLNLVKELGSMDVIGPILLGMDKSIQLLHTDASVRDIINLGIIAAFYAQSIK